VCIRWYSTSLLPTPIPLHASSSASSPLSLLLRCSAVRQRNSHSRAVEVLGGLLNASVRACGGDDKLDLCFSGSLCKDVAASYGSRGYALLPKAEIPGGFRPPDRLAVPPGRSRYYDRRRPHTTTPRFGPDDGAYRRLPPSSRHCGMPEVYALEQQYLRIPR
jgi:hypothetical protein